MYVIKRKKLSCNYVCSVSYAPSPARIVKLMGLNLMKKFDYSSFEEILNRSVLRRRKQIIFEDYWLRGQGMLIQLLDEKIRKNGILFSNTSATLRLHIKTTNWIFFGPCSRVKECFILIVFEHNGGSFKNACQSVLPVFVWHLGHENTRWVL